MQAGEKMETGWDQFGPNAGDIQAGPGSAPAQPPAAGHLSQALWRWSLVLVLGMAGCTSMETGPDSGGGGAGYGGGGYGGGPAGSCQNGRCGGAPPAVPGVQGPWGQNLPMISPYSAGPPVGAMAAQAMLSQSVPLDMVQMAQGGMMAAGLAPPGANPPSVLTPAGGMLSPPGVPFLPGGMPGGVQQANLAAGAVGGGIVPASLPAGAVAAIGAMTDQPRFPVQRTQVRFVRPAGMRISWYTTSADGKPSYSNIPIEAPGRYNFLQAAIYRLKLSNIDGRPGLEVYPTLEVVPTNTKTEAFLSHSSVPVEFTDEDFKQISEGNYVVKVIYLPDPQYQELAGTGTEEILSTRLEPGADPINEARRRGSILLVIRMGNMDQEAPNTPPMNAPGPQSAMPMMPQGMGMGLPPGPMVPYLRPPMGMGGAMGPMGPMPPPGGPLAGPNGGPLVPPPGAGQNFGPFTGPNLQYPPSPTSPFGVPNGAVTGPVLGPTAPTGPQMTQPGPIPGFGPPNNADTGPGSVPPLPPLPGVLNNSGPPPLPPSNIPAPSSRGPTQLPDAAAGGLVPGTNVPPLPNLGMR